jgi:hypothetical protein
LNPDAKKQVVTISPDGAVSSLQRKGDGLDLRDLGKVEIQRVSDIQWNNLYQLWFIKIISGPAKGTALTWNVWKEAGFLELPPKSRLIPRIGLLAFKEYEDAVKAEIIFLDALRKQGVF